MYRGRCRGAVVAVKVPSKEISESQREEFKQEVATMVSVSHPRLALFLGAWIPDNLDESVHIVMELLSGDLESILTKDREAKKLSLFQRMEWAAQAAEGLAWLHGAGLVHRDIKPSNMLYHAPSRSIKIADFGLSGLLQKGVLEDGRTVGNPRYWAPEVMDRKPYTPATDVYAWAISASTFVTRKDVFLEYWVGGSLKINFLEDVLESNLRPDLPSDPAKCPKSLKSLLEKCWDADPAKRLSMVQVLDEFEKHVLLDCAIPDSIGAHAWVQLTSKSAGGLQRDVPWDTMERVLLNHENVPALFQEVFPRLAVYKMFRDQWSPFGDEVVSLPHFGATMGFFPAAQKLGDGTWITHLVNTCRNKWFWGYSSRFEVEHYLRNTASGTFVIRCANASSFRLTIKVGNDLRHFKIKHKYGAIQFGVKGIAELEGELFLSLKDLADAVAKVMDVKLIEPARSPFVLLE